ncbi:MAG TPA: hypothetical protein VJ890_18925 [Vineibacter sp.]|nr:hypothetical protein [Vineibacter sp.]
MGCARWSDSDWSRYARSTAGRHRDEIFGVGLDPALNPFGVKLRESRDSPLNPESNAIIAALDVTGSMGMIAEVMAKEGLGTFITEVLKRRPVSDPHLMFMGIGDAHCDRAPLQVTQFEADIRIAEQLAKIWLEGGGGGNACESYDLAWYFAARHTAIDCFEKRRRKGILFTIGDEEPSPRLLADHVRTVTGDHLQSDLDAAALLAMVERTYDLFHIVVEEGSHARSHRAAVMRKWTALLGQGRVIPLADHTRLAEVMVSAIEVHAGRDRAAVAGSWSGNTSLVVARAVGAVAARTPAAAGGVLRF